jgi:internalin A
VDSVLTILERIPAGHAPEVTRSVAGPPPQESEGPAREGGWLVAAPRPVLPGSAAKQVFVSYAWGDDDSAVGRQRGQVVEGLCARLREWSYEVVRDREAMRRGDLISDFMRLIGRGDRVVVILSAKYLRSLFCMNELHEVFEHSRRDRDDFLRRVVAVSLPDARIATPRERAGHARHWKEEKEALQRDVADGLLGASDYALWQKMSRWVGDVSEMLAYLADRLHAMNHEEIVADDFSAVRELL